MVEGTPNRDRARAESRSEQADRRWNELLQEVRVVQTGAQILFGFLLSVAFTDRFASLSTFERGLYIAAVCFGASATGTLVGVVLLHFAVSGLRRKPSLVRFARRLVLLGIALLAVTVACVLLLLLLVVAGGSVAWVTVSIVLAWFAVCWVLLPVSLRRGVGDEEARPGDADR